MGQMRNVYTILVAKPEGKRPFRRGEDDVKMYVNEIGCEDMDWIHMAQE